MFIRYAAFHLQQLSARRQRDSEQKSIDANKEQKKEVTNEPETKSKDKEIKNKKNKKEEKEGDKKEECKTEACSSDKDCNTDKDKEDDLLLNENYSEIDTDVAKKIVESITDSICSGEKEESVCK